MSDMGSINVTVRDGQGEALPGVVVELKQGPSAPMSHVTNEQGVSRFSNLKAGPYVVSAELTGFQPQEKNVTVELGRDTPVSFVLQPGQVG